MEVWKQIIDYPNYSISNFGNIKNNKNNKTLKPIKDSWGYSRVNLYNNRKRKTFKIHHLVCNHFMDNFENNIIDHIDRNKENNNINNLRIANTSLNALNTNKKPNTTSKFRCCYFDKKQNKFIVRIRINSNEKKYLGSFSNELDAGLCYNRYIINNNLVNGFRKFNIIYQDEVKSFCFNKRANNNIN